RQIAPLRPIVAAHCSRQLFRSDPSLSLQLSTQVVPVVRTSAKHALAAVLQSTAQDGELVAAAGHVVAQSARAVRHVARALRAALMQAEWHRTSPKVQLCIHAAR